MHQTTSKHVAPIIVMHAGVRCTGRPFFRIRSNAEGGLPTSRTAGEDCPFRSCVLPRRRHSHVTHASKVDYLRILSVPSTARTASISSAATRMLQTTALLPTHNRLSNSTMERNAASSPPAVCRQTRQIEFIAPSIRVMVLSIFAACKNSLHSSALSQREWRDLPTRYIAYPRI